MENMIMFVGVFKDMNNCILQECIKLMKSKSEVWHI